MAARNRKVVLSGRGPATLREGDYVTTGGEGSIYRIGDTVVKLYSDPGKMVRDGMADKLALLGRLSHPSIVAPAGTVEDEAGHLVGFHMPFREGEPMPRIFGGDFRTRTGFSDRDALVLVERMRETVTHAHAAKAVMADANEFNWIVGYPGRDGPRPYVIDVDSWAIGRFPATVIMPSVRDWSRAVPDQGSDWFAWGVVAFQVLVGIHPYKGRLDSYRPGDLERRMRDRASVFAPGVRLPAAARDPKVIPGPLLDWFRATFGTAHRDPPPSALAAARPPAAPAPRRRVATVTGGCVHEKLYAGPAAVARTWPNGVVLLADGRLVDSVGRRALGTAGTDVEVVLAAGGHLVVDRAGPGLAMRHEGAGGSTDLGPLAAGRVFRAGERLFAVDGDGLREVEVMGLGRVVATVRHVLDVPVNATRWFDGVAVVDNVGASFLLVPLDDGGMVYRRAPALDGLRPLAGTAAGRLAVVLAADRQGRYSRVTFDLRSDGALDVRREPADAGDMNVAVLPKGVVASIPDDGELVIEVPRTGTVRKVADGSVTTAMRLSRIGDKVTYLRDGAVWRLGAG